MIEENHIKRPFLIYVMTVVLWGFACVLLYFLVPQLRSSFVDEDRFLENFTAFLFLGSFLVGVILAFGTQARRHWAIHGLVPLAGLMGLADELSFGERLLRIDMPIVLGLKLDGFHDLVELGRRVGLLGGAGVIIIFVLVVVGALLIAWRSKRLGGIVKCVTEARWSLGFLMVAAGCILAAMLIDLRLGDASVFYRFFRFLEELLEANAALALLFGAHLIARNAEVL